MKASCNSDYSELFRANNGVSSTDILLKPHSFMNILGSNVKQGLANFKVNKENLIVIHDDLEQKVGKFRIVNGTSFKGHNGLKSISNNLGGFKNFTRIGIGIGRPDDRDPGSVATYVLNKMPEDE